MKRTIITLASIFAVPMLACAVEEEKLPEKNPEPAPVKAPEPGADKAPDNTGKNQRDKDGNTLTPGDQGENDADRNLTQAIRKAVVKNKDLTFTAKNVKIITAGGKVTLRGPVNTEEEKTKICAIAKAAAGEDKVEDLLEVKAPK